MHDWSGGFYHDAVTAPISTPVTPSGKNTTNQKTETTDKKKR